MGKLNLCLNVDGNSIYRFAGKMNEQNMIESANYIESVLIEMSAPRDKIQNVFELFIETIQNILNYSSNAIKLHNQKREVVCDCTLSYFSTDNTYLLESCNLIYPSQRRRIEEKIAFLRDLDDRSLRQLIRKISRSKEEKHNKGAGLGYIIMTLKSSAPIEVAFQSYGHETLIYKQKLII